MSIDDLFFWILITFCLSLIGLVLYGHIAKPDWTKPDRTCHHCGAEFPHAHSNARAHGSHANGRAAPRAPPRPIGLHRLHRHRFTAADAPRRAQSRL